MKLGPYDVLGELGRGGMGVVFRARTPGGEEVALKLLRRVDAATLARFDRERRLLGLFTAREGFVPLLDAGSAPEGPYLVMPLLRGGTLRDRLAKGPLGVEETVALGTALARAAGKAHERGAVHRDLKPENVLFDAEARPLLADLGLAKHFDHAAPGASQSVSLSRSGDLRGTVGYMAPEQVVDAKSAGPPSDVFSLGAILYECLAGLPAFQGASTVEVLSKVTAGSFEPLGAGVPSWLVRVIEKALATDPGERFADGAALARALGEGKGNVARPGLGRILAALALGALVTTALLVPRKAEPERGRKPVAPEPRLRPGARVKSAGKEVQLYLWRLPSGGDMELVNVPAGDFVMGADDPDAYDFEKPPHTHRMDHAYWIGRNDVTWKQYLAYCDARRETRPARPAWARDDHPVVNVSWDEALAFCSWAGLALPSEAEWEKAARGENGRRYPWGDDWQPAFLNFADRNAPEEVTFSNGETNKLPWRDASADDGFAYTSPVGSYPEGASPYGALDMAGNVSQWCEDRYDARAYDRYERGDGAAPADASKRVSRGGGWTGAARYCRSTNRDSFATSDRYDTLGFRVCLRSLP